MDEEVRGAVDVVVVDLLLEDRDLRAPVGHVPGGGEDDRRIGQGRLGGAALGPGDRGQQKGEEGDRVKGGTAGEIARTVREGTKGTRAPC